MLKGKLGSLILDLSPRLERLDPWQELDAYLSSIPDFIDVKGTIRHPFLKPTEYFLHSSDFQTDC